MSSFNLKNSISPAVYSRLESIAEKPANQFFSGNATTVFATTKMSMDGVTYSMNTAYTMMNTNYLDLITTISETTWEFAKKDLKEYGDREAGFLSSKILTLPAYVAKRTTYWSTYYGKIELQKVKDELTKDQDKAMEEAREKSDTQALQNKIDELKMKISEVNAKVNQVTGGIYTYIATVTQYITAGPDWLENNLQKTITKTLDPCKQYIHQQITDGYNDTLKFLDTLANKSGQKIALKAAQKQKEALEKAMTKAEKAKKTAKSFAKSALQLIKQKALALIGG